VGHETRIVVPYIPRDLFLPFHTRKQRFSCEVVHRRGGKTVSRVNELIRAAMTEHLDRPRFAYIAPYLKQAKAVVWDYLKHYSAPFIAHGATFNEAELRADYPNGSQVRLYGADNPDALRGIYLDGVVFDEFGTMDPRIWPVVRPALSDREGWADFIGTPNGHNEFFKIAENAKANPAEWYYGLHKASQTGIVPLAELEAARKDLTPDQYAQEFECSFEAAIQGAYYGKEMAEAEREERIRLVPYDKSTDVITAWDLGIGDATAIWFCQQVGQEFHLIDYVENNGVGLDWYAREIKNKPYVYADHILPHDVEAKELGTGKSRKEVLGELGLKVTVAPRLKVEDGISAVRMVLNRCWFDKEKCARGVEALKQYRTKFDETKKTFSDSPLHDWTSHGADALRYLFTGIKKTAKAQWSDKIMSFQVDWMP
jgi:phage terminase large subunit